IGPRTKGRKAENAIAQLAVACDAIMIRINWRVEGVASGTSFGRSGTVSSPPGPVTGFCDGRLAEVNSAASGCARLQER
ncbi:MAG: hypothetical protein J2P48_24495, partial [Alphaproteobacteria bacterium]|nr:hypothetical protein [Alphaproteobacteria bacterium]